MRNYCYSDELDLLDNEEELMTQTGDLVWSYYNRRYSYSVASEELSKLKRRVVKMEKKLQQDAQAMVEIKRQAYEQDSERFERANPWSFH